MAKSRAAAPKAPDRRRLAAAALKVPTNLGATAAGRYSAFAREGRSDASAERLARYHSEQAGKHVGAVTLRVAAMPAFFFAIWPVFQPAPLFCFLPFACRDMEPLCRAWSSALRALHSDSVAVVCAFNAKGTLSGWWAVCLSTSGAAAQPESLCGASGLRATCDVPGFFRNVTLLNMVETKPTSSIETRLGRFTLLSVVQVSYRLLHK